MADPFATRQVVRLEHRRQAGEVSRRRHGNLLEVAQLAGMQAGVARPADTYREIDALADQIAELVIGQHFHLDLGNCRMNAAETLLMCHLTKSCGAVMRNRPLGSPCKSRTSESAPSSSPSMRWATPNSSSPRSVRVMTGGTGQQLDPEVGLQASQLLAE